MSNPQNEKLLTHFSIEADVILSNMITEMSTVIICPFQKGVLACINASSLNRSGFGLISVSQIRVLECFIKGQCQGLMIRCNINLQQVLALRTGVITFTLDPWMKMYNNTRSELMWIDWSDKKAFQLLNFESSCILSVMFVHQHNRMAFKDSRRFHLLICSYRYKKLALLFK